MEKEEKKTQDDWVVAISLQTYSCNRTRCSRWWWSEWSRRRIKLRFVPFCFFNSTRIFNFQFSHTIPCQILQKQVFALESLCSALQLQVELHNEKVRKYICLTKLPPPPQYCFFNLKVGTTRMNVCDLFLNLECLESKVGYAQPLNSFTNSRYIGCSESTRRKECVQQRRKYFIICLSDALVYCHAL